MVKLSNKQKIRQTQVIDPYVEAGYYTINEDNGHVYVCYQSTTKGNDHE